MERVATDSVTLEPGLRICVCECVYVRLCAYRVRVRVQGVP